MGQSQALGDEQSKRKEQVLTQHEPSKVRESTSALVLKHGSLFLLSTTAGDVPWERPHGLGLFFEDCRFLDGYELLLNGQKPTVLAASDARGFANDHALANPELPSLDGGSPVEKNTIGIRRERLIRDGAVHELIVLQNYGSRAARLRLELRFRATFEDIFMLRGFVDEPRGSTEPPTLTNGDTVDLHYRGCDGYQRTTALAFSPKPARLEAEQATFEWSLQPGQEERVTVVITPCEQPPGEEHRHGKRPGASPETLEHWLQRSEELWLSYATEVRSSNPLFDRVLQRSLLDLRLLRSRLHGQHYFAAGIPWFATLFGRDASTVAIQTMPYGPKMAGETLRLLARYQAQDHDPYRDAEPGKILHEYRTGELAQTDSIPQSPAYYGTVDATMLFLIMLSEYVNWSGDLDLARELRPNVEAALGWMERFGDHDQAFFDYSGEHPNGLVNQGWKDSGNAIVNPDGSLAQPPIALAEVQAYAFRAWRQTADLLRAFGDDQRAEDLDRRADRLRERFERRFWSDDLGCYLLALQRDRRPVAVVASNTGQVLWGGIASPERAAKVAERLMADDVFSGWGIRTLSSRERAYNPISYHLGSVWPHDNGLIAAGLRRYGHDEPALRVFDALFDAASGIRDHRLPELYSGHARRRREERPVGYPVACSPQAWASGALPHTLWTLLGLRANALGGRLRLLRPCLPHWLNWLEVRGLPVGSARVDLRLERQGDDGRLELSTDVREGELEIEQVDSLAAPDIYR